MHTNIFNFLQVVIIRSQIWKILLTFVKAIKASRSVIYHRYEDDESMLTLSLYAAVRPLLFPHPDPQRSEG